MALMWLLIALALGILTGKVMRRLAPEDKQRTVPGLPWIGNAIALGRHGAFYVAACRQKFGGVFTLRLAGQRMMLWLDPPLIARFFAAPEEQVTFRPAVEQFTQRVFGLPSKDFFPKHSQMLQHLRELLVPSVLADHAAALAVAVEKRLGTLLPHNKQVDLYLVSRRLVFGAGVETLFGAACLRRQATTATTPAAAGSSEGGSSRQGWEPQYEEELEELFHRFEAGFELAASPVPHALQPGWVAARVALLEWLGNCWRQGLCHGSVAGQLVGRCDLPPELAPHLLLAVLWASQANTVAATFWSIAFLLLPEHDAHKQAVLSELQQVGRTAATPADATAVGNEPPGAASLAARAAVCALDRKSAASRCVAEAVRLRVQSIGVRMAAAPFAVQAADGGKVEVPQGTILALNPFISHHDAQLYPGHPHAHRYDPGRGAMALQDATNLAPSQAGLAFGAGFYRCPGRFFAEMEVALITQLVLSRRRALVLTNPAHAPPYDQAGSSGDVSLLTSLFGPSLVTLLGRLGESLAVALLGPEVAKWGLGIGLKLEAGGGGEQSVEQSTVETNQSNASKAGKGGKVVCNGDVCKWVPAAAAAGGTDDEVDDGIGEEGCGGSSSGFQWLLHSGDPGGRLPPPDLRRLVGVKSPSRPCWVDAGAGE